MKTMPSLSAAITLMLLALLPGCIKNDFAITFEFPKEHVGNYILNYYAWNSKRGNWVENVASVQNGVAQVECGTRNPTLVYIRDASSSNSIVVYAERGDKIKIKGSGSDMNSWRVEGNKISERWSAWRNAHSAALSKSREQWSTEKAKAISDYVMKNPSDKLSVLILLTEWDRNGDADGFLKLWNSISKEAKSQQLIEMCGITDLAGAGFEVDAKGNLTRKAGKNIKRIVLRTRDNGIDTLHLDKVKATLMYFYNEVGAERNTVVDSLRKVADEYPDSAKRIITVVSLHPDSMAWINSVRRDTVKGLVRSWVPGGEADQEMIKLGVTRVPMFVVTGKKGGTLYSGKDLQDAVAAFRKEMKKEKQPTEKKKK